MAFDKKYSDTSYAGERWNVSVVDDKFGDRYDTPRTPVAWDITNINNFKYDMDHCIKCKGCYWVEHTYNPGVNWSCRCPSNLWNDFDAYGAMGKMRIGIEVVSGGLEWTDKLLEIIYADPLCGACDVGCKRNLDLEIELSLEAMRVKACDAFGGKAPLKAHQDIVDKIAASGNYYGAAADRKAWVTGDIKVADKADVVYFVGCNSSYVNPSIAQATAKILNAAGQDFMLLADEKCCGNTVFSVGLFNDAKKIAEENVAAVKATGAKTLLVSCAECYRMWNVDIPKTLDINTEDLGFEVMHIIDFADKAIADGTLTLTKPFEGKVSYHDACSVSRLCDKWVAYKGERGWMGMIYPGQRRRRGRQNLYAQARNIINAVPEIDFKELIRVRENSFCCGAGRGTKAAFPELAAFAAGHRIDEVKECGVDTLVSACPWCKDNFGGVVKENGDKITVMDITEMIAASL